MQFLFLILISVIVGASTFPHLMQAPNRPSFSQRKLTSFSLVSIPKFLKKVATFEVGKKTADENEEVIPAPVVSEKEESDGDDDVQMSERSPASEEGQAPVETGESFYMVLNQSELNSCVCNEDKSVKCFLSLEGYCSQSGSTVSVEAKTEEGLDLKKDLRCRNDNHFSAYLQVSGTGVGTVNLDHGGFKVENHFNLVNDCGTFHQTRDPASEDSEE